MSSSARLWTYRLRHIIDAIQLIQQFTAEVTYDGFVESAVTIAAVIRYLEIIGEAARYLPQEVIDRNSHIPWAKMRAMRNILIHEYDRVNLPIIWSTATSDLPPLLPLLRALLAAEEGVQS
ncbi:MAG: DUF86 domain-containing protein [Chloroflexi bacterium]|nr:DUF86 domain-containing protein [Chloroflexota bacterium]